MDGKRLARTQLLSDIFTKLVRISLNEQGVKSLASKQVTCAQVEALNYVHNHPNTTVGDLSAGLRNSYPSATNMVSRLIRKGLLKKRRIRADRRVVQLTLTTAGDQIVSSFQTERSKRLSGIFSVMNSNERRRFEDALNNFILAASRSGFADVREICLCCGPKAVPDCPLLQAGTGHECR